VAPENRPRRGRAPAVTLRLRRTGRDHPDPLDARLVTDPGIRETA